MFTKLVALLIAVVMVFGGAAATASAAQESLPMDALYPIKTLSENVALGLTPGSQAKLQKALDQVQRRVDEMAALSEMGEEVPDHLAEGYAEKVEYALRLASRMPDAEMTLALGKIQASLQEQLGLVEQLQIAQPEDVQMTRVATQLRQFLGLVAVGLNNPQMFAENLAVLLQGSGGLSATEELGVTKTQTPGDDNSNSANSNDSNSNGDDGANANSNDSNSNDDDANGNDDDANSNDDDDDNGNDDDSNSNDDDANGNDDDGNSNDDDDNGNDDDGNSNDDDANGNDDDGNSNDDDDDNGNDDSTGVTGQNAGTTSLLNGLYAFIAWIGSAVFAV